MARGLDKADCCAVCIGGQTPTGWFREEIQRALNRQIKDPSFRIIPVLLPDAKTINIDDFLELRTWVDFRHGSDLDYAFHLLICGVKGVAPGKWPPEKSPTPKADEDIEEHLRTLRRFKEDKLIDVEVEKEWQHELLARRFGRRNIQGGTNE
jgi:hypothetical protein